MPGGVQTSRLPLPATIIKQEYLPSLRASDPTRNSTEGTQFSRIRCRQESRWGSRAEPRGFPSHVYTLGKQSTRKQSACQSSYRRWKSLTLAFWVGATTLHRGSMPKWCDTGRRFAKAPNLEFRDVRVEDIQTKDSKNILLRIAWIITNFLFFIQFLFRLIVRYYNSTYNRVK